MYKTIPKLVIITLIFQTNIKAQNTPSNETHLFSLTEGISAPFRLAVNSEGTIYITDVNLKKIVKYDKSFNYIGSINAGTKPSASSMVFGNEGLLNRVNSNKKLFIPKKSLLNQYF